MDRDELIARVAKGESFDFLLFWGHRQKAPGHADASCLSQWFPASFVVDGALYRTAEHFMMAGKARLFGDEQILQEILRVEGPDEAKRLGRRVRGFDEAAWARARSELVVQGNVAKFGQNEKLRSFLLSTGEKVLVEASPRDRVWGIGMGASNPSARVPAQWKGLNLLGFALMQARARLR